MITCFGRYFFYLVSNFYHMLRYPTLRIGFQSNVVSSSFGSYVRIHELTSVSRSCIGDMTYVAGRSRIYNSSI